MDNKISKIVFYSAVKCNAMKGPVSAVDYSFATLESFFGDNHVTWIALAQALYFIAAT